MIIGTDLQQKHEGSKDCHNLSFHLRTLSSLGLCQSF